MRVVLDQTEVLVAEIIGKMRQIVDDVCSIKDGKFKRDVSPHRVHALAMIAEIAWAKWQNVFPCLSLIPRSGTADNVTRGRKVDIKATDRLDGRLLVMLNKTLADADIYVLAIVADNVVDFVGYATAQDVFRPENIKDLGYGPTYVIERSALRRFQEDEQ